MHPFFNSSKLSEDELTTKINELQKPQEDSASEPTE